MKKSILILIVLSVLFVTCENHVFDNPVDPGSDTYTGVESVDFDGDGVGSYEDVDEIVITGPVDGVVITDTASPVLTIQLMNPEVITFYRIQISTVSNFVSDIVFDSSTLTSNVFAVPAGTLENNTTYYWRAMAFDGAKWSDGWSGSRSFTVDIDTEVPITPSPIDGTNVGDATPVLDWENITGATGYHIQINTENNFTSTVINDDTLTASEYLIATPLDNNSTYYWRVKIKDSGALWGDWSNTWVFTVDVILDVPTNPSPLNGSPIINTTPLLEWGNVTGASSYEVEVSTVSNFDSILEGSSGLGVLQYQVTTVLSNNITYYWRVRIHNEDGIIGNWSTWSFSIDMGEPVSPSPSHGSTTIDTTPFLEWSDEPDAIKYEMQLCESNSFIDLVETNSNIPSYQYQLTTNLINNTLYYNS